MLTLLAGTSVEFTAAVCRNATLKPGGQFALLTLAGEAPVDRQDREDAHLTFYHRAVATGKLAGRLGTLSAGEALTGHAVLASLDGELVLAVQEAARLPHDPVRLELDRGGGARLLFARHRTRVRGLLISEPTSSRLENGTAVTNVRLGLSPRRGDDTPQGTQLTPLELAAYGDAALLLAEQSKGTYLYVWGMLQSRQGEQRRFVRLEVVDMEVLHETRALL